MEGVGPVEGIGTIAGVARVAHAASTGAGAAERASEVLEGLREIVPFDCAEISLWDPLSREHRVLANVGYAQKLVDHFHGPIFDDELERYGLRASGIPNRMRDVPGELQSIEEVLLPAGFSEGLTMCLLTEDRRYTGMLNLSTTDKEHPTDLARAAIAALGRTLANVADATRSARLLAGLVAPGSDAVGLAPDGAVAELPGISASAVLHEPALARAACALPSDRVGAFVWPADERSWHRIRVVPCADDGLRAVVTASAPMGLFDLTRRELEVLTLLAAGRSNPEIGSALYISARTAATYVERILEKLAAPTRAAAAARAVDEGLLVPALRLAPPAR